MQNMGMDYRGRQARLIGEFERLGIRGILITHMPNVRYLCGFTGSSGVLAVAKGRSRSAKLAFFTDGRYTTQAREQVVGARVVVPKTAALLAASEWMQELAFQGTVGFEGAHMTVVALASLRKAAKLKLKATEMLVERLRMVKEAQEIRTIRSAVLLASRVFESVRENIQPGKSEQALAAEIEYLCRRLGAEGMSFDTLVSSGVRSALPHGVASAAAMPRKGFVIMDFGVIVNGYCSDMTRTVHLGAPDAAARKMYGAVLEAQLAGIAAVRSGVETSEVDYAARNVLQKAGLGRYFTHSTGHGVGLEIHEPPGLRKASSRRVSKRQSPDRLQAGMVITIEPGAYVPGQGGVRIEDMVVVTETGCEVLTPTRKDLIVLR